MLSVFQRVGQEYASNVHAVDVVNSSDASTWTGRSKHPAAHVPEHYKPEHRDPDGTYAGFRATLSPIAYNTKQVKAEDAPKSFKDLLDPKWKGKIVKAHPGYSGTILTATFEMVRDIKLIFAEQPPEHHAGAIGDRSAEEAAPGEREVMADGIIIIFVLRDKEPSAAYSTQLARCSLSAPMAFFKAYAEI